MSTDIKSLIPTHDEIDGAADIVPSFAEEVAQAQGPTGGGVNGGDFTIIGGSGRAADIRVDPPWTSQKSIIGKVITTNDGAITIADPGLIKMEYDDRFKNFARDLNGDVFLSGKTDLNFTTEGGCPRVGDFVYLAEDGKCTATQPFETGMLLVSVGFCVDNSRYAAEKICTVVAQYAQPILL